MKLLVPTKLKELVSAQIATAGEFVSCGFGLFIKWILPLDLTLQFFTLIPAEYRTASFPMKDVLPVNIRLLFRAKIPPKLSQKEQLTGSALSIDSKTKAALEFLPQVVNVKEWIWRFTIFF